MPDLAVDFPPHWTIFESTPGVSAITDGLQPTRSLMMTAGGPIPDDAQKMWRYMSFSRFLWLVQDKQLWLSRVDMLGDPWEIALAGNQLAHVIARHPHSPISSPVVNPETAMQRSKRIVTTWRQKTFVSCWSASDHESHALWRIYCGSAEGVAIQTSFAKLRKSVGDLALHTVTYEVLGSRKQTPTLFDLATKKRPMFAYEHEVRIVLFYGQSELPGHRLNWDPEKNLESIRVHPDADGSFMETVTAAVEHYAPALKDRVVWSAMNAPPPF
jgi:hypothetical protein